MNGITNVNKKEESFYEPIKAAFGSEFPKIHIEITSRKIDDYVKRELGDSALNVLQKEKCSLIC